jgi:6-phosphogluconolactonase
MKREQVGRWQEFSEPTALEQAAARFILECAEQAIAERGVFSIVLAGGSTPQGIYRRLCSAKTDWLAWRVWFGDERCLPPEHPERNSRMARVAWLDHVPIPPTHIHIIPAELGPEEGAKRYARELASLGEFDLVLLGLGEDGHTASLFPGGAWEQVASWPDAIPIHDAPKPPPVRVSMSPARLSQASRVLFLVGGDGKGQALNAWRSGAPIPASWICPAAGVDVFLHRQSELSPLSRTA